ICIIIAFSIYLMSGREIFKKRQELRAFNGSSHEDPWANIKTTQIAVTTEVGNLLPLATVTNPFSPKAELSGQWSQQPSTSTKPYEQYTVNIDSPPISRRPPMPRSATSVQYKKNRAAVEANRAAWGYTKVSILFFLSLLVTWVPSSANRLYALAYPGRTNAGLAYIAGIVLSLMGFWNSVIYLVTSRAACEALLVNIFTRKNAQRHTADNSPTRVPLWHGRAAQRVSWSDSFDRLARRDNPV
ncbi:MAG: hypothetical protein Q9163_005660, partial [Psora crenata]